MKNKLDLTTALIVIFLSIVLTKAYGQQPDGCPILELAQSGQDCARTFTVTTPDSIPLNYNIIWDFGDGTTVVSSTNTIDYTFCEPGRINVSATILITNGPFSNCPNQILTITVNIPANCGILKNIQMTDLTACSSTLDYGFINIMTDIGNTVEWEYSSGNAVDNYNPHTGEILLMNALPGKYTVTISNDLCNSITETFIIEEECCHEEVSCDAPSSLEVAAFIDFPNNDWYAIKLVWDYVPEVQGYVIEFVPAQIGGFDCNNGPNIITQIEVYTETNNWTVAPQKLEDSCFAWRVKAICEDGSTSDYSPYYSFDNPYPSPN